jgi:hypothetical protein
MPAPWLALAGGAPEAVLAGDVDPVVFPWLRDALLGGDVVQAAASAIRAIETTTGVRKGPRACTGRR